MPSRRPKEAAGSAAMQRHATTGSTPNLRRCRCRLLIQCRLRGLALGQQRAWAAGAGEREAVGGTAAAALAF